MKLREDMIHAFAGPERISLTVCDGRVFAFIVKQRGNAAFSSLTIWHGFDRPTGSTVSHRRTVQNGQAVAIESNESIESTFSFPGGVHAKHLLSLCHKPSAVFNSTSSCSGGSQLYVLDGVEGCCLDHLVRNVAPNLILMGF